MFANFTADTCAYRIASTDSPSPVKDSHRAGAEPRYTHPDLDVASCLSCHETGVYLPLATIRKMPANRPGYNLKIKVCAAQALKCLLQPQDWASFSQALDSSTGLG